jgi:hypothetical protein|nr:MAG TPA: hypothetical protein [Caudoviricetes sp.]
MKKEDLNQFKGEIKTAIQSWGNGKIDSLFPDKAHTRTFFKNGLSNLLARKDALINKWLDTSFLFIASEDGTIDSDVMIDNLVSLFEEMDIRDYQFGMVKVKAGKGQAIIDMPNNFLLDMFVGSLGSIKFTSEDLGELKELLN